jgi:DNA-binding FadR family transcriptional regulator
MPLEPTRRISVIGDTATQLERMITSGEWPVGSRIPAEGELMAKLGVGRNSLREAIRALAHMGLLQTRQGDGTYVRASSGLSVALERYARQVDAHFVIETRRGLEREAARLAASRRTDEDLAALDSAITRQRWAIKANDEESLIDADIEFHQAVIAAAHNPVMMDLLSHLGSAHDDAVRAVMESATTRVDPRGLRVHVNLARAIRSGSPRAAAKAADELFDWTTEALDAGRGTQGGRPMP